MVYLVNIILFHKGYHYFYIPIFRMEVFFLECLLQLIYFMLWYYSYNLIMFLSDIWWYDLLPPSKKKVNLGTDGTLHCTANHVLFHRCLDWFFFTERVRYHFLHFFNVTRNFSFFCHIVDLIYLCMFFEVIHYHFFYFI